MNLINGRLCEAGWGDVDGEGRRKGHHRERGNRPVFWAPWSICYLCMGNWKPSLSLVKHDAQPQLSARLWLKSTLWSLVPPLAEAALLCSRSKWAERSRLSDPHTHALFIWLFYLIRQWQESNGEENFIWAHAYRWSVAGISRPSSWRAVTLGDLNDLIDWLENTRSWI